MDESHGDTSSKADDVGEVPVPVVPEGSVGRGNLVWPNPYPPETTRRLTLAERIRRVDPTMVQRYQQRSGE